MSKSNSNKQHKSQNPPHYMRDQNKPKDIIEMQKEYHLHELTYGKPEDEQKQTLIVIPKFRLGIDRNNEALITIDNTLHFMNHNQFDAFVRGIINIAIKINPESNYSELFDTTNK